MVFQFTFTSRFQKHYKNLTSQERNQLREKLELLAKNPTHRSLRTKRIQGTDKLYECSINIDIRIIWYYENSNMIILADVGHHDVLRQF